jgi:hypothetical protein
VIQGRLRANTPICSISPMAGPLVRPMRTMASFCPPTARSFTAQELEGHLTMLRVFDATGPLRPNLDDKLIDLHYPLLDGILLWPPPQSRTHLSDLLPPRVRDTHWTHSLSSRTRSQYVHVFSFLVLSIIFDLLIFHLHCTILDPSRTDLWRVFPPRYMYQFHYGLLVMYFYFTALVTHIFTHVRLMYASNMIFFHKYVPRAGLT